MQIHESINDRMFEDLANCYDDLYFRAENIRLKQYRDYDDSVQLVVTDLTNALKPGKDVTQYIFKGPMWEILFFTYDFPLSNVLEKLYAREVRNIEYRTRTLKGTRVFSPFAKVKPITPPAKWTLPHVWKAILAGQITYGQTDMRLTDDYAWDNATNFGRGEIDVLAFAQKIIEDPSGWWVTVDKETDDEIILGVNCHHFDCKTLVFSKNPEPAPKTEELPENVVMFDPDGPATKRQLWALHCITKLDTRGWKITKKVASDLISRAKAGKDISDLICIIVEA